MSNIATNRTHKFRTAITNFSLSEPRHSIRGTQSRKHLLSTPISPRRYQVLETLVIYAYFPQTVSSLRVFRLKLCMHLSLLPCVLHTAPSPSFRHRCLLDTNYEALRHPAFPFILFFPPSKYFTQFPSTPPSVYVRHSASVTARIFNHLMTISFWRILLRGAGYKNKPKNAAVTLWLLWNMKWICVQHSLRVVWSIPTNDISISVQ